MENIIKEKLCKYCTRDCTNCLSLLKIDYTNFTSYRCLNFKRNEVDNMKAKYACIRYTYYDINGNIIAVVYKGTPKNKIDAIASEFFDVEIEK